MAYYNIKPTGGGSTAVGTTAPASTSRRMMRKRKTKSWLGSRVIAAVLIVTVAVAFLVYCERRAGHRTRCLFFRWKWTGFCTVKLLNFKTLEG